MKEFTTRKQYAALVICKHPKGYKAHCGCDITTRQVLFKVLMLINDTPGPSKIHRPRPHRSKYFISSGIYRERDTHTCMIFKETVFFVLVCIRQGVSDEFTGTSVLDRRMLPTKTQKYYYYRREECSRKYLCLQKCCLQ